MLAAPLNALLGQLTGIGTPVIAIALGAVVLTWIFGREEWHGLMSFLAKICIAGIILLNLGNFATLLGV